MPRVRTRALLLQDKGVRLISRKSSPNHADSYATPIRRTPRFWCPRAALLVLLVGVSVASAVWWWDVHVNVSASVPRGLYRTVDTVPTRESLVAACLPPEAARVGLERGYLAAGHCPGGAQAVLKRVAAVAGDLVEVSPAGVRVNGRPLPNSAPAAVDSRGRPLAHVVWGQHAVRTGELWLISTEDPRGWDSRYFGPVLVAAVRSVARPVLTLD
jgi:conjugative transfer signal peptidase TraF